jgi:hypothetical protein
MQNKDNDKGNEDWLSIVEEKRIEKFIVEMDMPSVLLCKILDNPFGIYRQRIWRDKFKLNWDLGVKQSILYYM